MTQVPPLGGHAHSNAAATVAAAWRPGLTGWHVCLIKIPVTSLEGQDKYQKAISAGKVKGDFLWGP